MYFRAPVHIITGSAGCQEGRDHFLNTQPKWSAFRSQDFGYTKFKAFNGTHLYMEQVSVDLDGQVIDSFWLVKNKTVPFSLQTLHNIVQAIRNMTGVRQRAHVQANYVIFVWLILIRQNCVVISTFLSTGIHVGFQLSNFLIIRPELHVGTS